jgi:general secretion pathway protein K
VFVVLVLSFFLFLSTLVITSYESTTASASLAKKVYLKQQAYHAIMSIIPYILQGLSQENRAYDSLLDSWAFPFEVETPKGTLRIRIIDQERYLNLNRVATDETYLEVFKRLLTLIEIPTGYTEKLLFWLRNEGVAVENGYPPKGGFLDSPEELLYAGFRPEHLYGTGEEGSHPGLLELVTVHSSGKININTAPKYVLMALDPRIDSAIADRIVEHRATKPFKSLKDLVLVEGMTLDILYKIEKLADVKSAHFKIIATVQTGDVETTLEVIYHRERGNVLMTRLY